MPKQLNHGNIMGVYIKISVAKVACVKISFATKLWYASEELFEILCRPSCTSPKDWEQWAAVNTISGAMSWEECNLDTTQVQELLAPLPFTK
jgi:hypothetical protein